jgi:hypothetical protein
MQAELNLAQFEDGGASRVRDGQAGAEANREAVPIRTCRDRRNNRNLDVGGDI